VDQGHGATGLDELVEPVEGVDAVHPMERTAHGDQEHGIESGAKIVGTALHKADIRQSGGGNLCLREHRGLGVDRDHVVGKWCEGDGKWARSAPEIHDAVTGKQADAFGDTGDQGRRIGRASGAVMSGRGVEAVGLEGDRFDHRGSQYVPNTSRGKSRFAVRC
jgi:hypothetical protein